ncbi:MAG: hypothetical protein QXO15_12505 [Nitrososphaerota archaeon]
MKAKVIAIAGPVGVGKSTVIKVLTYFLNKSGLKIKSTYIKAFHGPSYLLWKFVRHILALRENGRLASWYIIGKVNPRITQVLLLISIYLDTIIIPFILMLRVKLPKALGITVLVEEYLLGTLLEYAYSFYRLEKGAQLHHLLPFKALTSLCIKYKPDFTIILDANLSEIRRHWNIRGYGDPQVEYVLFQRGFLNRYIEVLYEEKEYVMKFNVGSISPVSIAEKVLLLLC